MFLSYRIKLVIKKFLEEQIIVASWGISNVIINEESIQFEVCGFLYHGVVLIVIDDHQDYSIKIGSETLNCKIDDIVETIDEKVEKGDGYDLTIKHWLLFKLLESIN